MHAPRIAAALLPALLLGSALVTAQDQPLTAGSEGVPVPKKKKHVQPVYPPEALAQGIRGIVILDLLIDAEGRVTDVSVIRSIPGLDAAAVAAASQWEYEPTKVNGRLVSVRLTVPITFALKLPEVSRQSGIPELRQGVSPPWPDGTSSGGRATADVTLDADGRIGVARILEGEEPWSTSLIQALRTWRFAIPPEDSVVSFRVEADFVPAPKTDDRRVELRLAGLRQSQAMSSPGDAADVAALAPAPPPPPATTSAPAAPEPARSPTEPQEVTPETAAPATGGESESAPPESAPPEATPSEATPSEAAPPEAAPPEAAPSEAAPPEATRPEPADAAVPSEATALARNEPPPPGPTAAPEASEPVAPAGPENPSAPAVEAVTGGEPGDVTAPPPIEVITAAPPPPPPENGISALQGVTLEPGVPDLTQGRRPVAPPFARMARASGEVEVDFSVGAGGTTTVGSLRGPDVLQPAARAAVETWSFRRTRADRLYLTAVFTYDGDHASATIRPQALP